MQLPYCRSMFLSVFAALAIWALTSIVAQVEPTEQSSEAVPQDTENLAPLLVPQPASPKEQPGALPANHEDATLLEMPSAQENSMQPTQSEELKAFILAQLKDIRMQDLSKAYYAYTAVEFQKAVPLETFKLFMRTSPGFANNRSFELQNISFKGLIASVKGVLIDANERQTSVQYELIQENGQWKVRKIDVNAPNGP